MQAQAQKDDRLQLRIPRELKQQFVEFCKERDSVPSMVIRRLIAETINAA